MSTRVTTQTDGLAAHDAGLIIERLKSAIDVNTDADLAAALSISRTTLSNWRARNSVPLSRIREACRKYRIPIDYLLTGDLLHANQPLLDVEVVGYLFRILARYGFLTLPEPLAPEHDPAQRAAAEFAVLHRDTRGLLDQMTSEGAMSPEEAKRSLISRLTKAK
ncbi:helix-turn-helix domain-containing protein [Bosea sp. (in: a-proteobacteria)]